MPHAERKYLPTVFNVHLCKLKVENRDMRNLTGKVKHFLEMIDIIRRICRQASFFECRKQCCLGKLHDHKLIIIIWTDLQFFFVRFFTKNHEILFKLRFRVNFTNQIYFMSLSWPEDTCSSFDLPHFESNQGPLSQPQIHWLSP